MSRRQADRPAPPGAGDDADDIVVSGLSGRLPQSDNIEQFAQQLFAGVDLVTADASRWTPGLHGLPERSGKLKDLSQFDATHFGVHAKQAHLMDPQLRLLLEITHEAMVDAGVAPAELRGSRTGVFVGVSNSETEELWTAEPDAINGYALTGCCRAMFPNRVSFAFDLRGPSYAVDTACSSSMFALAQAVAAMRAGHCDAAVVAGTNLCLKPATSLNFHRLSMLSPEGRCAAFDAAGRGYVRSEAAVAVLLQRRGAARRAYATVRHARCNTDGAKPQGITFPSGAVQRQLAEETFREAGLSPRDVVYVEAHGTGTKVGDPQEVNAIAEVFCGASVGEGGRAAPLLLGSVKSNMGHAEPASGLCSLAKVLLAMERGELPSNLHYSTPNPDIPALSDGRIKVVDGNTAWSGGLVAVNSFGFGGANAHVILEGGRGERPPPRAPPVPRLLLASGRTEEAVESLLSLGAGHVSDGELLALLDAVHAVPTPGHAHRGYALLDQASTPDHYTHEVFETESGSVGRPVWLVFSGMGSQWAGMGRSLLRLRAFADSIAGTAAALQPHSLDLVHLLTDAPESAFENVVNSFVSIAAVQVALVDVLRAVGVPVDGIVGHSVGEIGCAYADGTLSGAQAVLAAYWRGRSIVDAGGAPGAMAAVGLTWPEAERRCPPDIFPACHNSADSVTVSGPPESIERFVAALAAEGVFARRVNSSGVAFHSKYIAGAAPQLRASLAAIIPQPKPRSPRWISSSVPQEQWGEEKARLSDATYHVNNLLSPVRFAEALAHVPAGALVVEVAPHALLQAVLKRALPNAAHVPLLRRDQPDQLAHLLAALGRIYSHGGAVQAGALYETVRFPVSRGTPALASRVKWDHSTQWSVANFSNASRTGENVIEVDLSRPEDSYLAGHNIDGRVLFPATGYLTLVWRTMAKLHNKKLSETAVVLEEVQFMRATILPSEGRTRFLVSVLDGSGAFEVCEGGGVVVSGTVRLADGFEREALALPHADVPEEEGVLGLVSDDIYKELRLRGYQYAGAFRGVLAADGRGRRGALAWRGDWVSFMDTMLQFGIVGSDSRDLYLPTRLQRALIDPARHLAAAAEAPDAAEQGLPVAMHRDIGVTACGGVEFRGIKTSLAPRRLNVQAAPKLETYSFVPYDRAAPTGDDAARSKRDALLVLAQIALENAFALKLKVVEVALGRAPEALLLPAVLAPLDAEPLVRTDPVVVVADRAAAYQAVAQELGATVLTRDILAAPLDGTAHLTLATDALTRHGAALGALAASLAPTGMLLLQEQRHALDAPAARDLIAGAGLVAVARQAAVNNDYLLLKRAPELPTERVVVDVSGDDYQWVDTLRDAMQRAQTEPMRVLVVSGEETSGVLGLATCLRQEGGGATVRAVLGLGAAQLGTAAVRAQLDKDLAVNVWRAQQWGSYRHLPLGGGEDVQLQVEHAYVNTETRGDLSSLRWIESPLRLAAEAGSAGADRELCTVHYAPLNFRDIMLATGKLPPDALPGNLAGQECILGLEFSGVGADGRRVMGMVAAQGLATHVLADRGFLWDVPAHWTLEQAASVPVAYATAYYALVVRGGMARGCSVLVHAGSGGVGQAAISIALAAGCRVFATLGTPDKRAFLRQRFPALDDADVGNSRDCSFEQLVRARTAGRGVDLVLNSLAGAQLAASLRCLADGGRFLEIGKLDLSNNTPLGMSLFLKNTTFHGILLDALFAGDAASSDAASGAARYAAERAAVLRAVADGIASGAVRPLPTTVYAAQQLEPAFRFMATGKHIGKVLLRVRDEEPPTRSPATPRPLRVLLPASPRTYMHPAKSYLLVGGLGGFGLELAGWLVARGATKLLLTSRSGVRTGYQAWCIRRWRERGVTVEVSTTDAGSAAGARALVAAAERLGPLGGVFNLAAVLRDAFLDNLTPDDFRAVARPKIDGSRWLDEATRGCASLEHFVLFSSVSCGRGNAGQTNYGLANSAMERLAELRRSLGLPATAVQWGAVGDVGLVMAMGGGAEGAAVGGTVPQRIASCLAALGALLALPHAVTGSMVLADKRRAAAAATHDLPHAVANVLGIKDYTKVSATASLAELGMDSLMGAEIKQTLERSYDVLLGVADIRNLTFAKLKEMSGGGDGGEAAPAAEEVPAVGPPAPAAASPPGSPAALAHFHLEELMPKETLVTLPSQPAPAEGQAPAFMVHPIEGSVSVLRGVARGVRGGVRGLQCTRDAPLASIGALAAHYVAAVRAHAPQAKRYTLVGYSFGAGVAFEMALQLEKGGSAVQLVLIDGSPAYVATHTRRGKSKRSVRSPRTDEADALAYFVQLFVPDLDTVKVSGELERLGSWEARVAHATSLAGSAASGVAAGELAAAAGSFYRKLVAADGYAPDGKLRAPVTLFSATDNYVALSADYGLRAVCAGPLALRPLPADHRSILAGAPAATIADHISELLRN